MRSYGRFTDPTPKEKPCRSTWTSTASMVQCPSRTWAKLTGLTCRLREATTVSYLRYWVDGNHGTIFCLVEAPNADAAATVHREAHGLVAEEIYEVQEGS